MTQFTVLTTYIRARKRWRIARNACVAMLVFVGVFGFAGKGEALIMQLLSAAGTILGGIIGVKMAEDSIIASVATLVFNVIDALTNLFLVVVYNIINVAQYTQFIDSIPVTRGWEIIRDICNMFFVLILLAIAIGTILQHEKYTYSKTLPKLISAAILINFSKTIAGLAIDFANVVMLTFVGALENTAGGNFMALIGLQDFLNYVNAAGPAKIDVPGVFLSLLLTFFFMLVAVIVVVVMLYILIARVVALWFLVILSPAAFFLSALPDDKGFGKKWWDQFVNYLIVGPVMMFFLWLSFATLELSGSQGEDKVPQISRQISTVKDEQVPGFSGGGGTAVGSPQHVLGTFLGIIMLLGSMVVAQQLGVEGGKMAGGVVEGARAWAAGKKGPSPMRWARERYGAFAKLREKERQEKAQRFAGKTMEIAGTGIQALGGVREAALKGIAGIKVGKRTIGETVRTAWAKVPLIGTDAQQNAAQRREDELKAKSESEIESGEHQLKAQTYGQRLATLRSAIREGKGGEVFGKLKRSIESDIEEIDGSLKANSPEGKEDRERKTQARDALWKDAASYRGDAAKASGKAEEQKEIAEQAKEAGNKDAQTNARTRQKEYEKMAEEFNKMAEQKQNDGAFYDSEIRKHPELSADEIEKDEKKRAELQGELQELLSATGLPDIIPLTGAIRDLQQAIMDDTNKEDELKRRKKELEDELKTQPTGMTKLALQDELINVSSELKKQQESMQPKQKELDDKTKEFEDKKKQTDTLTTDEKIKDAMPELDKFYRGKAASELYESDKKTLAAKKHSALAIMNEAQTFLPAAMREVGKFGLGTALGAVGGRGLLSLTGVIPYMGNIQNFGARLARQGSEIESSAIESAKKQFSSFRDEVVKAIASGAQKGFSTLERLAAHEVAMDRNLYGPREMEAVRRQFAQSGVSSDTMEALDYQIYKKNPTIARGLTSDKIVDLLNRNKIDISSFQHPESITEDLIKAINKLPSVMAVQLNEKIRKLNPQVEDKMRRAAEKASDELRRSGEHIDKDNDRFTNEYRNLQVVIGMARGYMDKALGFVGGKFTGSDKEKILVQKFFSEVANDDDLAPHVFLSMDPSVVKAGMSGDLGDMFAKAFSDASRPEFSLRGLRNYRDYSNRYGANLRMVMSRLMKASLTGELPVDPAMMQNIINRIG